MNSPSDTGSAATVRGLAPLARLLAAFACLILFAMMVLTFVDVLGRYVFLKPVPAAYEIISLMMPGVIFCALPLTVLREGHVTVDLLDAFIPDAVARLQGMIVNVISAGALGLVAWRLFVKAQDDLLYDSITDELLLLLWPFGYGMAALCGLAALVALANAWVYATGRRKRETAA